MRALITIVLATIALIVTAAPTMTATTTDEMAGCAAPVVEFLGMSGDGGRMERWTC